MKHDKKKQWLSIGLLTLGAAALAIFAAATLDAGDVRASLEALMPGWTAAIVGCMLLYYLCDALKYRLITRAFGCAQPLGDSIDTSMIGFFYSAVTPAAAGGQPFQVLHMHRRGIPTPFGTTFIEKETAGIGAVGDIGSYSLDMLLNAVGYPKPLTVSGYTSNYFGTDPDYYPVHHEYAKVFGVDDFAAAFVRLEGGIILDFRISWAEHMDTCGDALILGTKGGLRIPSTDCWNGEFDKPLTVYKTVAGATTEYKIPLGQSTDNGKSLFYNKVRAFVDAVKYGGKPTVSSAEIIYNQAIIDGIVRSAELGKEVEITVPEV